MSRYDVDKPTIYDCEIEKVLGVERTYNDYFKKHYNSVSFLDTTNVVRSIQENNTSLIDEDDRENLFWCDNDTYR